MKKYIIFLVLLFAPLIMAQNNQDYRGTKAVLDSAGNTIWKIISTDTLVSEIITAYGTGSLQWYSYYGGNSDDSTDIKIEIMGSNFKLDRSFQVVQTLISADTDTGYHKTLPIFQPYNQFLRIRISGNAGNDSTYLLPWYGGEGLSTPWR
jgi:hypothetical protein